FHQPLLIAQGLGGTTAVVTLGTDGGGGTVVANGGAIELQGNITVGGEPLIIQGPGVAASPTPPLRWFGQGPAPILNGQTPGNGNVSGRVTGVAVDSSDPNAIYISTAAGRAP